MSLRILFHANHPGIFPQIIRWVTDAFIDGINWVLQSLKGWRALWPHAALVSGQDPEQASGHKSTHPALDGGVPRLEWTQDRQPSW